MARTPVQLSTQTQLAFSPGKHNELQKSIIEAVTTANPITEWRRSALLEAASTCSADTILVTAFPDRQTYRKFAHAIAWETEVWIADAPEHMIHFNGDKFLGPHQQKAS